MNIPDPSSELLDEASESVIDALLCEIIANETPPDLKRAILDRLHDPKEVSRGSESHHADRSEMRKETGSAGTRGAGTLGVADLSPESEFDRNVLDRIELADNTTNSSRSRRGRSRRKSRWLVPVIVSFSIAVSLFGLIWLVSQSHTKPNIAIKGTDSRHGNHPLTDSKKSSAIAQNANRIGGADRGTPQAKQPAPLESSLLIPPERESSGSQSLADRSPEPSRRTVQEVQSKELPAIQLVSASINQGVVEYWGDVGVKPTAQASIDQSAARMSVVLGIEIPDSVMDSCESLVAWMRTPLVAQAISRSWWNHVSAGNFSSLDREVQTQLIEPLADSINGTASSSRRIDRVIASWLTEPSTSSDGFLRAMSGPQDRLGNAPVLVTRLASLTLSADLRCIRCHDSYIEGSSVQQDYWDFAAIIADGVRWHHGRFHAADHPSTTTRDSASLFFELPDRRQQVAEPGVASQWHVGNQKMTAATSMSEFADSLVDSRSLARGFVNSMWHLVHGAPLHSRVVDPMSPPMSKTLIVLEDQLTNDLLHSDFDLGRALALILSSPTSRRSVPESLRDVWARDRSEAHRVVIAFAGTTPSATPQGIQQKLDQILRSIGGKLETSDKQLLAQVRPEDVGGRDVGGLRKFGGKKQNKRGRNDPTHNTVSFAWDYPDQADEFPVNWLSLLKDPASQIEHLCYLSERDRVPPLVERSAERMRQAEVDPFTILHRIAWLLRTPGHSP